MRHVLGRDSLSGVADCQRDVVAGRHDGLFLDVGLVDVHIRGFNGEFAAFGHGVTRVGREIHEDLLDLSGIGFDFAQVVLGHNHQFDVLTDEVGQHAAGFLNNRIQIEQLQRLQLLTAEGKQLPRQLGGPARGGENFFRIAAQGIFRRQRIEHEFGIGADDHEQIVEVVRHASGELTDGLHLLCLAELGFDTAALADIQKSDHGANDFGAAAHGIGPVLDRETGTVTPPQDFVAVVDFPTVLQSLKHLTRLPQVGLTIGVGVMHQQVHIFVQQLLQIRVTQQPQAGGVTEGAFSVAIEADNGLGGGVKEESHEFFPLAKGRFRQLQLTIAVAFVVGAHAVVYHYTGYIGITRREHRVTGGALRK